MNRKKIIIIFIMITIVISAMLVYNSVFCYANTEAGRLQAVEDYISDSISSADFHVSAYKEAGKDLYTAFSSGNTYGILCLAHGINGKYRPIYASFEAFPYTQGVYYISTPEPNTYTFMGYNCHNIASVEISYAYTVQGEKPLREHFLSHTYPVKENNFIWLLTDTDIQKNLCLQNVDILYLHVESIRFFNANGADITNQYRDSSLPTNCNGVITSIF